MRAVDQMRTDPSPRMYIYLAGPDVFRPDALVWADGARALCRRYGYEPLVPLDADETSPEKICAANLAMIRRAQIVCANLDSFRGAEPDSGTCFEVGYAAALGKKLIGYVSAPTTVSERVAAFEGGTASSADRNGWQVEDFGLAANLMLSCSMRIVDGGLEAALDALRQRVLALG